MITLDYNLVIGNQYNDVEKGKKSLDFFNSGLGKWVNSFISPKAVLTKVNSILTSQLISSRGLLVTVQENYLQIKDKDTSKAIKGVNRLLALNIDVKSIVDELVESHKQEYPELILSQEVVTEAIENLYSVLRTLKRANLKTPIETTELAKNLSRRSVNSLEKVLYGR